MRTATPAKLNSKDKRREVSSGYPTNALIQTFLLTCLLLILFLVPPAHGAGGFLTLPLKDDFAVSCGFGCYSGHGGTDYGTGSEGKEVVAAYEGTVIVGARLGDTNAPNDPFLRPPNSYGNYIKIDHGVIGGKRVVTLYGHLQHGTFLVKEGDRVLPGQYIARSGNSGTSTGPHLHFEVRLDNVPRNPFDAAAYLWTKTPPVHGVYIPPSTLVTVNGDTTVYWLQNGTIYPITGPSIIDAMKNAGMSGWDWGKIVTVPDLTGFTVGPHFISSDARSNGLLVRDASTGAIYAISNGKKEHIRSFEELGQYNGRNRIEVAHGLLADIPDAQAPGAVTAGQEAPTEAVRQAFATAHGAHAADLGSPTDIVRATSPSSVTGFRGYYQTFSNGSVQYISEGPQGGSTFTVFGSIYDKWADARFTNGVLGLPAGNRSATSSGFGTQGYYQAFEGGSIQVNGGKAFIVSGAIYGKWGQEGYASGPLGLPTGDRVEGARSGFGTQGYYQKFEGGSVQVVGGQGFAVYGPIYTEWGRHGYAGKAEPGDETEAAHTAWPGFPVSDVYGWNGMQRQDFEGGYIQAIGNSAAFISTTHPTNLVAAVLEGDSVAVTWNNSAAQMMKGVNIYRTGSPTALIATLNPDATTYIDSTAIPGHGYTYRVVAFNETSESPESNEATVNGGASPGTIQLPQTGQTKCYNAAGAEIACPGTGQDGDIRAGVAWPNPRFANPDGTTPISGTIVLDKLTGLEWPKDGGTPTVGVCTGGTRTWDQALDYVACLNANNYLGHNDWRLPNINELESLVNANVPEPAAWLNTQGFTNVMNVYWSSTRGSCNPESCRWRVLMWYGAVDLWYDNYTYYVWPVRAGQSGSLDNAVTWKTGQTITYRAGDDGALQQGAIWPSPRFTDLGDGQARDNLTGLQWTNDANAPGPAACAPGVKKTWQEALAHIKCLNTENYLGHSDWRLPNRKELLSLADRSNDKAFPSDDPSSPSPWTANPFNVSEFYELGYGFWSSTTVSRSTDKAWRAVFFVGSSGDIEDRGKTDYNYVWPVRLGQGGSSGVSVNLVISKSGTGTGTVTSVPAGIDCGSTCSANFAQGTVVTLTAQATAGSTFTGWSGGGCSGTGTCTVTMDGAKNVTATFTDTTPPTTVPSLTGGTFPGAQSVTLTSEAGATIYYTTDGSDPTTSGTRLACQGSCVIAIATTTTLKYYAVDTAGNASQVQTQTYVISSSSEDYAYVAQWGSQVRGNGQFNRPRGTAVDSMGNVYVVDTTNRRVQKFTSSGTYISQWGTKGAGDGQFEMPLGIAVDSSNNVYVVDSMNSRVQKFTSSGVFLTKWGSSGEGNIQFMSPFGIAIDSAGYVYVTDTYNNRIQKFTSAGAFVTKWGSYGTGDGQFSCPRGIAIDSAGNVYVGDWLNNRVQKFTSAGAFVTKWGSTGSGNGQFSKPEGGLAVDPQGNVYVSDVGNNRVQKFTSAGAFISALGVHGLGDGQMQGPQGLAVDPAGNIYVADSTNNRIQKFDPTGTFVAKWGSDVVGDGQLNGPEKIAVDSARNVWVLDTANHRVQKFAPDGTFIQKWGIIGSGDGQLLRSKAIAVDSEGNVYVADTNLSNSAARIQKFTSTGTFLTTWGSTGTGDGQFDNPCSIAVDSSNNVYVVDSMNNRVQKFTSNGVFISKWGSAGTADGQFSMPRGIAIDASNSVYVYDTGNSRVQKFSSTGTFLAKWGSRGTGDGQFDDFYGEIAVDSSGNVFVADGFWARIQKFSSTGTFLTKWGSFGAGDGQFSDPTGVAVDSSGNVYVADLSNYRVQKFSREGIVPPAGSITINTGAALTNDPSVTLGLSATDADGVTKMMVSNDAAFNGAVEENYVTSKPWTLLAGDGTKTVYVKFKDTAGNWSGVYSDTIVLDATPPAPAPTMPGGNFAGPQSVTLTSEAGATIYYTTDGSDPTTSGTRLACQGSCAISITATTTLSYYAVDGAGNTSQVQTQTYTIQPGTIQLPQTGQTKCYSTAGVEIDCAGTGQDGEIKAGVLWNPATRFTSGTGAESDCMIDTLTGLMWPKNGNLGGTKTWNDAIDWVASLNSGAGICGHSDWRLPNIIELESLVNADETSTATWLNAQGFSNVQMDFYWSSTTNADYTVGPRGVDMWLGHVITNLKTSSHYVWPVRAGQGSGSIISLPKTGQTMSYRAGDDGDLKKGVAWDPAGRFTTQGDSVTDTLTGLVWTKDAQAPGPAACDPGTEKTWQGALDYVRCLNTNTYLGYSDWRLPNRKELMSLADQSRFNPPLSLGHPFVNWKADDYWSSTTHAYFTGSAWFVNMWSGIVYSGDKAFGSSVWPVRTAHSLSLSPGWNFLSFPLLPADPAIATVLDEVMASVRVVWGYDNTTKVWKKWKPSGEGANTLTTFEYGKGYWIYLDQTGSLTTTNWNPPPATTVSLSEGWNLIGYTGADNGPIPDTLTNRYEVLWNWTNGQWYGKHRTLATPFPLLDSFQKGRAYWIRIRAGQGPVEWVQ